MKYCLAVLLFCSFPLRATDPQQLADTAFAKGNYRDAFHFYSELAKQGNTHAIARLAYMHERGILVPQNTERAQALYRQIEAGLDDALRQYETAEKTAQNEAPLPPPQALHPQDGDNPPNPAQATETAEKTAPVLPEHSESQYSLAQAYLSGQGIPQDIDKALKLFTQAAESGHPRAQVALATLYNNGIGVRKNKALAQKWFAAAALQNHPEALYRMGLVEWENDNIAGAQAAWDYFNRAAAADHADAQYYIGRAYEQGRAVTQDIDQAVIWYKKSALAGSITAQKKLGMMYRDGWKIPQNHNEALKWLKMAAAQGDVDTQVILGMMYADGNGGVQRSVPIAREWLEKAAAQGDISAQEILRNL